MSQPSIPGYGTSTLAEILPSIGATFGLAGATNTLGLPTAPRYLVVLVDGLGQRFLHEYADHAPFLAAAAGSTITSGAPSTTATSISMLGTGLPPGQHGIAGYSFWYPPTNSVLATLRWPKRISGLDVQPRLTYLERLASAGVAVSTVANADFANSGLTTAALRGPSFLPVDDEQDIERRIELARQGTAGPGPAVGYFYERSLDHAGHGHGVGSPAWLAALGWIDTLLARLRTELDEDVRMVITGDHGMVNVPLEARLTIEDEPELNAEVSAVAGEGRLRHLMSAKPQAVASRWRDRLGERAWVRTRAEAFAEGWFGEVASRLADRFGDVIVAMAAPGALMSTTFPKEFGLVGMHGSLTPEELEVPLLHC